MTPDQLITFAAVAEHRNISRAAEALHLSQPAVSGQLRLLQEEFGEPLYQREGRGVRLTPTGEQLATYAAHLRDTWRQAHAYRDALRGMERGTLRIGASTTPASYLLPYLIADFHQRYPDVTLHTADGNTSEIVAALASVDIALIEGPVGSDLPLDTAVHPWREDEIVAIMPRSHPLAQGPRQATLAELGAWPLVLREAGSGVRQVVERAFARAAAPMRVALEIAGVEGVKEAVRAGMGIGFVSAMSMRHEDAALCLVSLAPEPCTRRFSILLPHASAPSRAAQRFLELCMAEHDRYAG
ncbi:MULTISPECIES: LysR substrate-binding domain-containing protein [Paraburkholderia]|uniref:LysR substrate-binding domain-containing protein n=1 Tax=Paraburkholderia TaxID=1822464 RepID=UPI002259E55B|nr:MULTISPECIES: LysR substrate-binding domain-containing protein [Paraburkholderia]MCX4161960.1 LysR substrate-binding domain-containing protein [Paraburkholderia megapolitana]MDN7157457.1 LysR substrate-binding domain-containing protein [Paraburkholderia sp. CHISQ3]MDQ6494502.1 LysR substrate-binding domain-containing protein [Paraburkholderia megapolitana]